jgi:hypothetical protein
MEACSRIAAQQFRDAYGVDDAHVMIAAIFVDDVK